MNVREVNDVHEVYPNYYKKFRCIADKCKHNCCIGWEIDIDDYTLSLYNSIDTSFGKRIRENIEGDVPHFKLKEGDQCPFLNEKGLCEIIQEFGEDAICDICTLHPRFCNFYSSFTEIGLGLCCEEAARIILSEQEKFCISLPENVKLTKKESNFFEKRQKILNLLQDRTKSIAERFDSLGVEANFSTEKFCALYLALERLDEKWADELNSLMGYDFKGEIFRQSDFQMFFEQLAVYFIFRHFNPDSNAEQVLKFTLVSCMLIGAICEKSDMDFDKAADIVRMYSSEIEYSDENMSVFIN